MSTSKKANNSLPDKAIPNKPEQELPKDSYQDKLDQILDYRKNLSILIKKDRGVFKTDIDYDTRVKP